MGARDKNDKLVKWTSGLTVLGIIVNRFNISLVAYNYHLPSAERYFPHWMEIVISVFIVTVGLVAFKFISTRMPIFFEHPAYKGKH